jgi:hypothetical protein
MSTETTPTWRERLVPRPLRAVVLEFRQNGFRGVVHRFGWKLCLAFFLFYLVRDSILYLLLPYLVARGVVF